MTQALTALRAGWTEHTKSPTLNTTIGFTKLLASGALTYLAIQRFPRMGLAGGVALSFSETADIFSSNESATIGYLENAYSVKAGLFSVERGIQLITIGSLLNLVGSTLYYRNVTLWVGIGKVGGSLFTGLALIVMPIIVVQDVLFDSKYTVCNRILSGLGVRHPWDMKQTGSST